jgi:hypothetical protein
MPYIPVPLGKIFSPVTTLMLSLFQVLSTTGEASDHLAVPPDRGQHTLGLRTASSIPVDGEEAGAEEDHVADIRLQPIQSGGDTATSGHTSRISHQSPAATSRQPPAVTCCHQQQPAENNKPDNSKIYESSS